MCAVSKFLAQSISSRQAVVAFAWKIIRNAGQYNVRLYKGWQEIERSQEFTIVAQN